MAKAEDFNHDLDQVEDLYHLRIHLINGDLRKGKVR